MASWQAVTLVVRLSDRLCPVYQASISCLADCSQLLLQDIGSSSPAPEQLLKGILSPGRDHSASSNGPGWPRRSVRLSECTIFPCPRRASAAPPAQSAGSPAPGRPGRRRRTPAIPCSAGSRTPPPEPLERPSALRRRVEVLRARRRPSRQPDGPAPPSEWGHPRPCSP